MPNNLWYIERKVVEVFILVKLDFNRPFILDVDWSMKGVATILSQKHEK
jgi:hypothetical protein